MANKKLSHMLYLGGHSAWKGLIGILAFPEDYPTEKEFTVFYTMVDDDWLQLQFDFDIADVAYLHLPKKRYKGWWLVGKRGEVVEVVSGKSKINHIETAGTGPKNKYGYLSRIRVVDGELFVCGHRRQVYQRDGSSWLLISESILDNTKSRPGGFESIDGFSKKDIYAVGRKGEIWHYDGKEWTESGSPTNQHLADVRCFDGKVWVCGDGGLVLCGREDEWEVIWDDNEPSENWWSVESFQNRIYLAGNDYLGMLKEGSIVSVDTVMNKQVSTLQLHQKDGILWSIGENDVLAFDGKKWKEVVCPENK